MQAAAVLATADHRTAVLVKSLFGRKFGSNHAELSANLSGELLNMHCEEAGGKIHQLQGRAQKTNGVLTFIAAGSSPSLVDGSIYSAAEEPGRPTPRRSTSLEEIGPAAWNSQDRFPFSSRPVQYSEAAPTQQQQLYRTQDYRLQYHQTKQSGTPGRTIINLDHSLVLSQFGMLGIGCLMLRPWFQSPTRTSCSARRTR